MKIKIADQKFLYFNSFVVDLKLDSVASTFSFLARFDADVLENRLMFKPFSYPDIKIYTDSDKLLLTGEIVTHDFNSEKNPTLTQVSGYSKAGILEDCNIPLSAYPLENLKGNLREISTRLLNLFGIGLIVDGSVKKEASLNYEKSTCEPTETIKEYLSKLAGQRNIVMSNDVLGNIIYFRPNTKAKSKYFFHDKNTGNISLSANGQGTHSVISIIRQPSHGNNGVESSDTVHNGLVKRKRTAVKKMSSGEDTNTSRAVKNALAAELKALSVTVNLNEWLEDLNCGDIVDVHSHDCYLFKRTRMMISGIKYIQDVADKTMDLTLMLPEAFSGDIPQNIFDYDNFGKSKEQHH